MTTDSAPNALGARHGDMHALPQGPNPQRINKPTESVSGRGEERLEGIKWEVKVMVLSRVYC